jgi:tyrosine-protein kinase Etk/Wzc
MTHDREGRLIDMRGSDRSDRQGSAPQHAGLADARPDEPTVLDALWVLVGSYRLVLGVTGAVLVLAVAYLLLATPKYRSSVVVQVEDETKTLAGLQELTAVLSERTPAETEIQIIRSRSLLDGVVEKLGLDVEVRPRTFPVIGSAIARRYKGSSLATPFLGLDEYAWGGERLRVQRLDVSEDLIGEPIKLTATGDGTFQIAALNGEVLAMGRVGRPVDASRGDTRVSGFVSELVARTGTSFTMVKRRPPDVVDTLREELSILEKGKKTGIIAIELEGPNPAKVGATLESVSNAYLRQNVERKSAEAAKTLEFIESQLPIVKGNVETAEGALNKFRLERGTVDLTAETLKILERSADIQKGLQALALEESDLRQRFTEHHPAVEAAKQKMEKLRAQRDAVSAQLKTLPRTELESARLVGDAKVANELYSQLLNKAQQLRVAKSGTIGNVRVLDSVVVPHTPASPKPKPVLVLALVLGLVMGVAGAFARRALHEGTHDPDEIERATGLAVYATIPHSENQAEISRRLRRHSRSAVPILAAVDPGDIAVENLRSLRTSLQFALVEASSNVIAIGGPAPDLGKSFVTVNLAYVLATADRRILVVDGDMRRGRLYRYFGDNRSPGLSDLVTGTVSLEAAIRKTELANLDFLASGRVPPNPAELLGSARFRQVLGALSARYDLLVVDTPPILAVTDTALIARMAGVNLLVLRAGRHPVSEISLTVKRLAQNGIKVHGAVLNDMPLTERRYGKLAHYYQYEYRSSAS